MILASDTYAISVADPPLGKAFTIELEAVDFGALAAWVLFFLPEPFPGAIAGQGGVIMAVVVSLFQKFLKQIFVVWAEALLVYHTQ